MANRFTRQQRLAEVGEAGQARLGRGSARVPAGAAGAVAALYLERAGVGTIVEDATPEAIAFAHAGVFHHGETRAIGAGAWHALAETLRILEPGSA
jgi:hypothetical protein